MPLSDEDLLDFDHKELGGIKTGRAPRVLLERYGDLYRNHVVMARWVEGWRKRMEAQPGFAVNERHLEGVSFGLRVVVAHLRQGDFLPGGDLYEEEHGRINPAD